MDIDLFLNQHTGEFTMLLPPYVNLLPELPEYSSIERPMKEIVKNRQFSVAIKRLHAKFIHKKYLKTLLTHPEADESIFQCVTSSVSPALRDLSFLGEYDLAISFLCPHNIVLEKVRARKKICWIHTDYSKVHINAEAELPIWNGYDRIVSISNDVTKAFINVFPTLRQKIMEVENILLPDLIRQQAEMDDVSAEMPVCAGMLNFLSIGRFSVAKRLETVPLIGRQLLDKGLRFKWYILGYGPDSLIRENIKKYDVADTVILLGKKTNPYPYIKACDLYVQPSLFEGKSITVREAQILGKPPVITDYPTSKSQIHDGVDGKIVPLDIEGCSHGIFNFATDSHAMSTIRQNLQSTDFGNMNEVEKIYALIP